jgi:2-polyprenyl-3-methyl-5-hydroxy-6-metoxy-1,4-benzoquinol methylase
MQLEDRTQGFFHRYAGDFDAIYSNRGGLFTGAVNRIFRKSMRLRFEKSIEGCSPIEGKTVLDVGCGPGHYAITLAQRGAGHVLGIDFADGMLHLAQEHAQKVGVADRVEFRKADFSTFSANGGFDYVVLMGFMDYMPQPDKVIARAISLTRSRAFFSFPADGGLLAWQRRQRYKKRCDLFMYTEEQIRKLFAGFPGIRTEIEPIARDYFVTASVPPQPEANGQGRRVAHA